MLKVAVEKSLGTMRLKIDLEIKRGDFIAISGNSGSGKTSFLRVLAGLENSSGEISIGDEVWQNAKFFTPVQKRGIGFLFQDYGLFPNMTILGNLLFVEKDMELAKYLLEVTEMWKFKDRYPDTLSGGEKQRVALCRAFMKKPKLLLLDEPLSALHSSVRSKLQSEILKLHKEFKTTTVMVSHNPNEIYHLANRVLIFENGKVIKDGTPKDVLLQKDGSQKFSFKGEIVDINRVDIIFVATVSIGQQLVEVVLSSEDVKRFQVGETVLIGTKAFSPKLSKI
jgi:molybdate transport system ATP-binding protein